MRRPKGARLPGSRPRRSGARRGKSRPLPRAARARAQRAARREVSWERVRRVRCSWVPTDSRCSCRRRHRRRSRVSARRPAQRRERRALRSRAQGRRERRTATAPRRWTLILRRQSLRAGAVLPSQGSLQRPPAETSGPCPSTARASRGCTQQLPREARLRRLDTRRACRSPRMATRPLASAGRRKARIRRVRSGRPPQSACACSRTLGRAAATVTLRQRTPSRRPGRERQAPFERRSGAWRGRRRRSTPATPSRARTRCSLTRAGMCACPSRYRASTFSTSGASSTTATDSTATSTYGRWGSRARRCFRA
eukprot:Opistho-1_new@84922